VSLDLMRLAVELVSAFRGRGLAVLAVAELAWGCPRTLASMTPLSPGGEALVARLGLARADHTPQEAAKYAQQIHEIHQGLRERCRHGRKRREIRAGCANAAPGDGCGSMRAG
jgi:hypothetical protein